MDPDRLLALYNRQRQKVEHCKALVPHFERCAHEIGRFGSLNRVCVWLDENGVSPTSRPRPNARWHRQTLSDFLYMDGIEPTPEALVNHSRKDGMRVAIMRLWGLAETAIEWRDGEVAANEWRVRIDEHCKDISLTAQRLRSILGK